MINVFLKVYLDFVIFFSGVFIGIIRGTPAKRISEGLFCLFLNFCLGFYRYYRGDP